MPYTLIVIISIILLIPGIFMSFVPTVPGIIYMLVISLLFAIIDHFTHVTALDLGILGAIALFSIIIETISGFIGAKAGGAHWSAMFSGLAGFFVGQSVIPVPVIGGLIGMVIGVLASELYITGSAKKAGKSALASVAGSLAGVAVKVVSSVAFLILFVVFCVR